jgi:hypothetical protein
MDEETLTVWLDTALLILGGFVLMAVVMLAMLNPPTRASEAAGQQPPGNVIVEVTWPDGLDADVDLWVEAPGDRPVGYSNKSGSLFNLLRDDLGKARDMTDLNYEVAYSRGVVAGEYVVNVHLYRAVGVSLPVEVKVVASVKLDPGESPAPLVAATVPLRQENEEVTAFRFSLDAAGHLVTGSANHLFKPLRVAPQ